MASEYGILVETFKVLYEFAKRQNHGNKAASAFLTRHSELFMKLKQNDFSRADFLTLRLLGVGTIGIVELVQHKCSRLQYALKSMSKSELAKRGDVNFLQELEFLCAHQSPWLVKLAASFQDDLNIYLLMQYYKNGDLFSLLDSLDSLERTLEYDQIKHLMAEIIMAIASIHELKYVHRDIKPENILFDNDGHVIITDFGSCVFMADAKSKVIAVAAGTPSYLAPEILENTDKKETMVGYECDVWAVGVLLFHLLFGFNPFEADSLMQTYQNIMNCCYEIPDFPLCPLAAADLIKIILVPRNKRCTLAEVKRHKFFYGVDWDALRLKASPILRDLKPSMVPIEKPCKVKDSMNCLFTSLSFVQFDAINKTECNPFDVVNKTKCPDAKNHIDCPSSSKHHIDFTSSAPFILPQNHPSLSAPLIPPSPPLSAHSDNPTVNYEEEISILKKLLKEAQLSETMLRSENRSLLRQLQGK